MRRQSAIAALMAGLTLPVTLQAQFRGGPRAASPRAVAAPRISGGFSGFRPAPSPLRSGGFRSSPVRTTPFQTFSRRPSAFRGRPGPLTPRFIPRIHFRRDPFSSGFGFPSTFFYAFPPYYPYSSPLGDDYGSNAPQAAAEPQGSGQDDALVNQVQALTEEVDELHSQQAAGQSGSRGQAEESPSGFEEKSVPAVFVYHDGHQLEAQNYAIMGQTLWVFGEEMTRKVPLADLDLAQTRKLNDQRGIDFTPPELR